MLVLAIEQGNSVGNADFSALLWSVQAQEKLRLMVSRQRCSADVQVCDKRRCAELEPMYAEAAKQRQRAAGSKYGRGQEEKVLADLREPISRDEWASEQAAAAVALSQLCDRALSVRASTGEGRRRNLSQIRDRFLSVRTSLLSRRRLLLSLLVISSELRGLKAVQPSAAEAA